MAADARTAGTFTIGDHAFARLGFGAMRVSGADIWSALALLRRSPAPALRCS